MFALRRFAWVLATLWLLSQGAALAHTFDEHKHENSCAICIQLQNDDDVLSGERSTHSIQPLEERRFTPIYTVRDSAANLVLPRARAPPFRV